MVKIFRIILFFLFVNSNLTIFAQCSLTIKITDLRNNKGHVFLELLDKNEKFIEGFEAAISNNEAIIEIKSIAQGSYSFKYFHDENKNKELDTKMFGIPKEGFGFSNDVMGTFGPPDFDKTIFKVKGKTTIKSIPNYF